ncbi:ABC transporter permease [Metabacillus malikii]|uniref:Sodium transport system permease protein n=1 Tax=Metabacillus malikii TaxID=1504265 RepID=A0ABT9ZDN6_9BACI|nr:ABC transporter permease [Metabacillus malikii]MDQ0230380.1 sodium transport system permease protein [Metabacillus malikii]
MTWHVFVKEMKDSLRDRKTIMLSVLLPILFNIGLLFFMENFFLNDDIEQVKIAVDTGSDKEVVSWLKEVDELEIVISEEPLKMVENGEAVAAFSADPDFMSKMANNETPSVTIQADPVSTKGGSAQDTIMALLTTKKQEFIQQRLVEHQIDPMQIEPFQINSKSVSEGDDMSLYVISMFAQLIIVIAVLMGGLPAANDLFAGEKERNTMEALIMTPVNRLHIIIGKWLTIASLSMISGIFSVITFIAGVHLFTKHLADALNLDQNLGFFTISLVVGIIFFALLVSSLQMMISLMANNLKEAQNYISPITTLAMVPYFFLIGVSANELSTTHFIIPFVNIYALIKQLIYGIYDVSSILLVVGSSTIFIAISFLVAYMMFMKSKWVLGKG